MAAWASLAGQSSPPGEFILRSPADLVDDIAQRHRLIPIRTLDDGQELFLVRGPADVDYDELEDDVDGDSDVRAFEHNQEINLPEAPQAGRLNQSAAAILETLPDRTPISYFGALVWNGYANQSAASVLRLAAAHSTFRTGTDVIAVIDTGVDPNHHLLRDVLVPGFDFTRDEAGVPSEWTDISGSVVAILEETRPPGTFRSVIVNQSTAPILDGSTVAILETSGAELPVAFGHGTMVAGLVHLVAPTARVMPLKAFRADGSSTVADILRAIYFAADNGARVINMSFSLAEASDELMRAINYATSRGVICVASVGNGGSEALVFPAGFRHVIGVGSINSAGARSLFSNYGRGLVRLLLPGEELITSYPGGHYAAAWGTSFSTAIAAGAAALLTHLDGAIAQERVDQLLAHAQQDLPKALQALAEERGDLPVPPPPAVATPSPSMAATFLIADEDALRAGEPPNFFSAVDVNENKADVAARSPLSGLQARVGTILTLATGQVGNEGWFALKSVPSTWRTAGPTFDGLRNFAGDPLQPFPHRVGPGLGRADAGGNREALLDKIPGVTPLRATGLKMLEGGRVCAVVQKGDVNVNYGPLNGSLKGAKLGTVAFEVLSITRVVGTSGALPDLRVRVLDPRDACQSLRLFVAAPVPVSSSVPFDTMP